MAEVAISLQEPWLRQRELFSQKRPLGSVGSRSHRFTCAPVFTLQKKNRKHMVVVRTLSFKLRLIKLMFDALKE